MGEIKASIATGVGVVVTIILVAIIIISRLMFIALEKASENNTAEVNSEGNNDQKKQDNSVKMEDSKPKFGKRVFLNMFNILKKAY